MPVGPHILWPEKTRKSQPISCTSIGRWPGALGGVDEGGDAELAGAGAELGDGVDGAERVGDVRPWRRVWSLGEEGVEQARSSRPIVAGDGQVDKLGAGALGEQLPRDDVAVVLHLGEQDLVAGLDVLRAPGLRDEVDALGGAAGEDDLVGTARVDEVAARVPARLRRRRWRGCSTRGCRDGHWRCRARSNGAGRRSPRAASAWWRRCRSRSRAGRAPSDRGWESRPESDQFQFWCSYDEWVRLSIARSKAAQLELGGFGHHALVPGRVPDRLDGRGVHAFRSGDELFVHVCASVGPMPQPGAVSVIFTSTR